MASLFLKLLNMSIAASWLILAVIVLRIVLKRAPKWIHCILWALVGIRLLCPLSIESALSLIPSSEPLPPEVVQFAPHPAINKQGGIGGTDSTGKSMMEVFFYSNRSAMYAVELRYPAEATEGFGTRLHVIQDTFQVSNSGQEEAQN